MLQKQSDEGSRKTEEALTSVITLISGFQIMSACVSVSSSCKWKKNGTFYQTVKINSII